MSMKLYADKLGEALSARGVTAHHVIPPEALPARLRTGWLGDRLDSYLGRYAVYPRLARRLRADVFHIVDHGQAHLVTRLEAKRTVVTCHDVMLLVAASGRVGIPAPRRIATRILRHSLSRMRQAGWVVAVSEQTRRDMISLANIDPARVSVVTSGLNYPFRPRPELRAELRRRLGVGPGPTLLQVGAVHFYKNLPAVFRVLHRLRAGGIEARLVRCGQRLPPDLRALAETLGVSSFIDDRGPASADELADLYSAADLLLFPSLYEGFGWPPLEAMASGLPVVCSRAGSLAEVVGEAALTADPENIAALTEHCAAVLTQPDLAARLRERGVEHAKRFSWATAAEQMCRVYERVLGS